MYMCVHVQCCRVLYTILNDPCTHQDPSQLTVVALVSPLCSSRSIRKVALKGPQTSELGDWCPLLPCCGMYANASHTFYSIYGVWRTD